MKEYHCRCSKRTKKWMPIVAQSAQKAAEIYAEECRLEYPDIVTIMDGREFRIYQEILYHAKEQP